MTRSTSTCLLEATGGGLDCDNNFLEEQSCYEAPGDYQIKQKYLKGKPETLLKPKQLCRSVLGSCSAGAGDSASSVQSFGASQTLHGMVLVLSPMVLMQCCCSCGSSCCCRCCCRPHRLFFCFCCYSGCAVFCHMFPWSSGSVLSICSLQSLCTRREKNPWPSSYPRPPSFAPWTSASVSQAHTPPSLGQLAHPVALFEVVLIQGLW